ncbi:MAG: alpha/beta hydrolase, partial [Acidobacteria bacterium]|nr:alpha/beta hydrolase [Acidobacteriota bacterium]
MRAADATLALRRFGSGPALLLVHGFPLHGFTWRKLLPELSRHFTCHVVDLAGKGDSAWTQATDFSFPGHARRLKLLMDHLGLGSYSLLGQDTGATIARCLALMDTARVQKLVLINTEIPHHRPPWIPLYQFLTGLPGAQISFRLLLGSRWYRRSGMGFGGCFTNLDLLDGEFHQHTIQPLLESPRRLEGVLCYLRGLTWPVVDALAENHRKITAPVLLVWGEDDPTFPIGLAREMTTQFPDCRGLVAIAHTKLLPHEERPDQVLAAT